MLIGLITALSLVSALAMPTLAIEVDPHKATICHATSSETNPYVKLTVDYSAIDGQKKNDHSHHVGDIIPSVDGVNIGQNWTEGQEIWDADCQIAEEPAEDLGEIVIEKVTDPSSETESFAFAISDTAFALADGDALSAIYPAGDYAVAEFLTEAQIAAGWSLEDITCSDGTAIFGNADDVMLSLQATESIVCTFLNAQETTPPPPPPTRMPDVVVSKSASVDQIDVNGSYDYVLTVRNVGNVTADGVVVNDNLDNDLLVDGWTTDQGTCALAAGNQVNCDLGSIAAGASVTVTVSVTAGVDTCGSIDNQARVSATNEGDHEDNNNRSQRVVVTVDCGDGDDDDVVITVMKHVCPDNIQTQADFDALGSFVNKVLTCPVITVPGNQGPAGALDAGDAGLVANGQTNFVFTITDENGVVQSMANGDADFVPAKLCEATIGDVDGNPSNNVCVETSHYMFPAVEDGPTTITELVMPEGYRYGALEFTPDSLHPNTDDETLISEGNGVIVIDTTEPTQSDVMLHVYNFANVANEQDEGIVRIMKHVCPESIQTEAQFDALGSFLDKVLACPVITLPGDAGPTGALDADDPFFDQFMAGGETAFNFTVLAGGELQDLDETAFEPMALCEATIGDIDGDTSNNACVEVSDYRFDGVAQGDVAINESETPDGFRFGSIEFTPGSGDADSLVGFNATTGTVELDTSSDADVMVHVYNFENAGTQGGGGSPKPKPSPREGTKAGLPNTAMDEAGPTLPVAILSLVLLAAVSTLGYVNRFAMLRRRR